MKKIIDFEKFEKIITEPLNITKCENCVEKILCDYGGPDKDCPIWKSLEDAGEGKQDEETIYMEYCERLKIGFFDVSK